MLSDLLIRIRSIFRRNAVENELDTELHFHFDQQVEKFVSSGLSQQEARRRARLTIGASDHIKEECREARGTHLLENFVRDIRYALRMLRKNPGFTTVAVLTLALSIAVNATMFSLVSAFLLRRPPVLDPDRVVVVSSVSATPDFQSDANPVSAPNFFAWREANHVFADMAAAESRTASLSSQGQPESLRSAAVTHNYFSVLGVTPQIGRTFEATEDQPGNDHVVILSHELWQRRFGADASILGRVIRINRENYTVIGVIPETFRLLGFTPQLWTPLALTAADQSAAARKDRSLFLFARLNAGVSLEQSRAEMLTLARRTEQNFPETEKGWGAAVRTLPDFLLYTFGVASGIAVMMTAVAFVLLIACANVAGLLLARAAGRRKELAVRVALGAGRFRIIRQLLTEGLVIALIGGGLGLLLSYWGINFVRASLTFNDEISAVPVSLDTNVLLFAIAASAACAVMCGLIPSLKASRANSNSTLKDETRAATAGRSYSRTRTIMVAAEIALALFLLVGTGLLIDGISTLEHQNLGFRAAKLLTASLTLDDAHYKDPTTKILFAQDLVTRLQKIPGAESVALASRLPATGSRTVAIQIKDQSDLPPDQQLTAIDTQVTPEFFHAAAIPVLRGRSFTTMDNSKAPRVAVVNQEFVHRLLHDQDPLGKQIRLDLGSAQLNWTQIVGVVANVKSYSEDTRNDPQIYEPFLQHPVSHFSIMLLADSDPNNLASFLRDAVAQSDSELPISRLMSMPAVIDSQKLGNPFFLRVLGVFAILALILAAIGIYGLVAYSVGQRTHEIGIRMALGANRPDVLRMILREGLKMTIIGAAIGLAIALPLPKLFESMFFGLRFREPALYAIVPLAIIAVSMFATYIPARRASRVDPIIALRHD